MQDNRKALPPAVTTNARSPGERDRMIRARDRQIRRRRAARPLSNLEQATADDRGKKDE